MRWFVDYDAIARGEPGITHSFTGCLATALDYTGYLVDPVWLMGVTGFAFRIWVDPHLSPDAMNAFDWQHLLPQTAHRAGLNSTYIQADTSTMGPDDPVLHQAHEAIHAAIDRGIPAIVWDLNDPPMWGLIYGYNDFTRCYETFASWKYKVSLPYDSLGRRDVRMLSVLLLEDECVRKDDGQVARASLQTALLHAEGREMPPGWKTRSGLAAFDLWADLLEPDALPAFALQFVDYYAEMYFAFRCYARDYVARLAAEDPRLEQAATAYGAAADALRTVFESVDEHRRDPRAWGRRLSSWVREARAQEAIALHAIRDVLDLPDSV